MHLSVKNLKKRIELVLTPKIGTEIMTEAELCDRFLNDIVLPYLRASIGLLADAKLERRIKRGRYDARIGSLVIEFENPAADLREGIEQAKRYVEDFRDEGIVVNCFVTNGRIACFVDENKEATETKPLADVAVHLQERLTLLALLPASPDDILRVLGPSSDISRSHLVALLEIFRKSRGIQFISECYDLWSRVYGAATNLSPDAVEAVRHYARELEIELEDRSQVEEFVFVIETYLAIFMKLLLAAVAVRIKLIQALSMSELLLDDPLQSFEKLGDRVYFLRRAFEHDAFSWFVDSARRDKDVAAKISEMIKGIALALDKVDLSKVRVDMLRRAYQSFFDPSTRKALGEFYTNEDLVGEVLTETSYSGPEIVEKTLLDPACGSGTFLIVAIRRYISEARRKGLTNIQCLERITKQIRGIDIHPFAVTMARVNYLLAVSELVDKNTRSILGKIGIPIYWTDSLATFIRRKEPTGLPIVEVDVAPLGAFLLPDPEKYSWQRLFEITRKAVEERWPLGRYLDEFPKNIRQKYETTLKDLLSKFKERAIRERDSRWLSTLHTVIVVDTFRRKCDYVVGNPPWVRIRNVDEQLRNRLRARFSFYGKGAGWNPNFSNTRIPFGEQVDYAMAFVESGLRYLKDDGRLGFLITSNIVRSLYGGKMREFLIRNTTIRSITDYSLSRIELFEGVQNSPLIITLEKKTPTDTNIVKVGMQNRAGDRQAWEQKQGQLPLYVEDFASPWIIAPPNCINALRKMQLKGVRLGDNPGVNRGIMTSANEFFVVKRFEETDDPDVLLVETERGDTFRIEKELLRPFFRGRDLDPWNYRVQDYIIWTHDDLTGRVLEKLPHYANEYFAETKVKDDLTGREKSLKEILEGRDDYKKGQPPHMIFRVSADKLRDKVAWQMIAKTIEAACLPSDYQDKFLGSRKLIVDHAVYFLNVQEGNAAKRAAAFLNSTPARVYASAYVNRTGAEYCQFFAWIVGLIPAPLGITDSSETYIIELAEELKMANAKDEALAKLDKIVASLYGLSDEDTESMRAFHEFFTAG